MDISEILNDYDSKMKNLTPIIYCCNSSEICNAVVVADAESENCEILNFIQVQET